MPRETPDQILARYREATDAADHSTPAGRLAEARWTAAKMATTGDPVGLRIELSERRQRVVDSRGLDDPRVATLEAQIDVIDEVLRARQK